MSCTKGEPTGLASLLGGPLKGTPLLPPPRRMGEFGASSGVAEEKNTLLVGEASGMGVGVPEGGEDCFFRLRTYSNKVARWPKDTFNPVQDSVGEASNDQAVSHDAPRWISIHTEGSAEEGAIRCHAGGGGPRRTAPLSHKKDEGDPHGTEEEEEEKTKGAGEAASEEDRPREGSVWDEKEAFDTSDAEGPMGEDGPLGCRLVCSGPPSFAMAGAPPRPSRTSSHNVFMGMRDSHLPQSSTAPSAHSNTLAFQRREAMRKEKENGVGKSGTKEEVEEAEGEERESGDEGKMGPDPLPRGGFSSLAHRMDVGGHFSCCSCGCSAGHTAAPLSAVSTLDRRSGGGKNSQSQCTVPPWPSVGGWPAMGGRGDVSAGVEVAQDEEKRGAASLSSLCIVSCG